jgi:hypothetical protein
MKTIELKLYKFDELSEEVQAKVIEKNRDINVHDDWHEFTTEEWITEEIPSRGFEATKIYYSGFWSQGDGAMFEYDGINNDLLKEFVDNILIGTEPLSAMRKQWILNNVSVSAWGKHRGHYHHEKCCSHSITWEADNGCLHWSTNFYQWLESFADDFEVFIIDKYEDICRDLYKSLEEDYDYFTSDEQIIESLRENNYDFTEDGDNY